MPKRGARKAGKTVTSKAGAIREFSKSNPDAKPKAIAEALNAKGYTMTAQYVSMILSNDRRKAGKAKTRKSTSVAVASVGRRSSSNNGLSVDDLRVAKSFVNQVGGIAAAKEAVDALAELAGSN